MGLPPAGRAHPWCRLHLDLAKAVWPNIWDYASLHRQNKYLYRWLMVGACICACLYIHIHISNTHTDTHTHKHCIHGALTIFAGWSRGLGSHTLLEEVCHSSLGMTWTGANGFLSMPTNNKGQSKSYDTSIYRYIYIYTYIYIYR